MKLLTKKLRKKIPPLDATRGEPDPMVWCKFFFPVPRWGWYVTEFDRKELFFGYIDGDHPRLGYFRFADLFYIRDMTGEPLKRELNFKPRPLSEVTNGILHCRN